MLVSPHTTTPVTTQLSMKIAILKERRPHETRVAATPETVKKLKALGAEITIEAGAGTAAAVASGTIFAPASR